MDERQDRAAFDTRDPEPRDSPSNRLIFRFPILASLGGVARIVAHRKPVTKMTFRTLKAFFYDYAGGYNWVFPMDTSSYIKIIGEKKRKMLTGIDLWRSAAKFC